MSSLNIPPIISYEKIVRITAAQEAGSLKVIILFCFLNFVNYIALFV